MGNTSKYENNDRNRDPFFTKTGILFCKKQILVLNGRKRGDCMGNLKKKELMYKIMIVR